MSSITMRVPTSSTTASRETRTIRMYKTPMRAGVSGGRPTRRTHKLSAGLGSLIVGSASVAYVQLGMPVHARETVRIMVSDAAQPTRQAQARRQSDTEIWAPEFREPLAQPATHSQLAAAFARRVPISIEIEEDADLPDDIF